MTPPDSFAARSPSGFVLALPGGRTLDLTPFAGPLAERGAHVMGILNVTPDSFSDGGRFLALDDALRQAEAMLNEGATLLDVGGESTRPRGAAYGAGAEPVSEDEEKRRVVPVVEALARRFPEALVSVDTYKPGVAAAALGAGAHVVNDVTGLRLYPGMADVCAAFGAPLIVMHSTGVPGEAPPMLPDAGVVEAVVAGLRASVRVAHAAGVAGVVVDAGFGFGKTAAGNLRLVGATGRLLAELGRPVLVGVSRKSTIGAVLGTAGAPAPVEARLFGTLGATAVAVLRGATLVRTHDVRATAEMLRVLAAASGG